MNDPADYERRLTEMVQRAFSDPRVEKVDIVDDDRRLVASIVRPPRFMVQATKETEARSETGISPTDPIAAFDSGGPRAHDATLSLFDHAVDRRIGSVRIPAELLEVANRIAAGAHDREALRAAGFELLPMVGRDEPHRIAGFVITPIPTTREVYAVTCGNYEPAEVDSLWLTREGAERRASDLGSSWDVVPMVAR